MSSARREIERPASVLLFLFIVAVIFVLMIRLNLHCQTAEELRNGLSNGRVATQGTRIDGRLFRRQFSCVLCSAQLLLLLL